MASAKKVVLQPALTVRVVCDQGHALTGLFVIFKLKMSEDDDLVRVVEASPHPGDPPTPPEPTGKKKQDAQAQAAYRTAKKQYDAALAKHEAAPDKTTPPDPSDRFALGIVDDQGFLQPVHAGYNPWYDVATGRDPDTYKLAVGEQYEVCALRHPSPALARALTRYLNGEANSDDRERRFDTWGALTRTLTITSEARGDGVQPVMTLSERVEDFVPRGSSRYGGWLLYRDMPHQGCAPLADPVRAVQTDLAKLRYPIGGHGSPFEPTAYVANAKEPGGYTGQVQAAVARFQEHVDAGESFVLAAKEAAHAGAHWVYVLGEPFDPRKHADKAWKPLPTGFDLGVVDSATANRIAHWITHGLRKPSEILVESATGSWIWLLERGAIALDAWSLLAEAFGVHYGVKPGSSLRSVLVGAWPGAILNSVHKTGLAVDLAGGGARIPSSRWPIRYEASWEKNQRKAAQELGKARRELEAARKLVDAKREVEAELALESEPSKRRKLEKLLAGKTYANADAQLDRARIREARILVDDDDAKLFWRQRWRLYGHSDLDVFNHRDREIARLKQSIAKLAGLPVPGSANDATSPIQPRGELWHSFARRFRGVGGALLEAWLDRVLVDVVRFAEELLASSPAELVDRYFRTSVVQWHPNFFESDGGSTGKRYRPNDGDDEYPAVAWAKSWVNLSALGYPCQLERIGPHTNDVRDQTWVRGPDNPKASPVWRTMNDFFKVAEDESQDIVVLLSDIAQSTDTANQHKHADTDVPVRRAGEIVVTYKPGEIAGEFVKQWRLEVEKLDTSIRPGDPRKGHSGVARASEIALILSATEKGKAVNDAAIDMLAKLFGRQHFVVVKHGELAKLGVDVGVPVTGERLATALRDAAREFERAATVSAKAAEREVTEKAAASGKPKKKTRAELLAEKKAAVAAARKLVEDWTVVVQPMFVHEPDLAVIAFAADDQVLLPPGSAASHLEWWHYQHRSATKTWGELLAECGYSQVVMGTPKQGPIDADGLPVHRGLGYSAADLASHPGGFNEGTVENRDQFTPTDA